MLFAADERVWTQTGRLTTPFPKGSTATERRTARWLKAVDEWLVDNAVTQTREDGGDPHHLIRGLNPKALSPADRDFAEAFLFDPGMPRVSVPSSLRLLLDPPARHSGQPAARGTEGRQHHPQQQPTTDGRESREMTHSKIHWINRGRVGCKGDTITVPDPDGTRRTTCARCPLEWTTPAPEAVSA